VVTGKGYAFVDLWQIARTGATVLASNSVPVAVALDNGNRLQYGGGAAAQQVLAAAGTRRLAKTGPTARSAADHCGYGARAFWSWDWNLAFPHFGLGIDWDGIFGYGFDRKESPLKTAAKAVEYAKSGIAEPQIEPQGYNFPELAADGTVKQTR